MNLEVDVAEISRLELIKLIALSGKNSLNLRGVDLSNADLHHLGLAAVDLSFSELSRVNL
ncbi:MAG: pentapeptide repeat-containing protein, partial [Anaerolineales bacterium]